MSDFRKMTQAEFLAWMRELGKPVRFKDLTFKSVSEIVHCTRQMEQAVVSGMVKVELDLRRDRQGKITRDVTSYYLVGTA